MATVLKQTFPTISAANYNAKDGETFPDLLKIYSVTYDSVFYFLPYEFKMSETFGINWNQSSVIGRMDPLMTFKNMTRTMNIKFKARQKDGIRGSSESIIADSTTHPNRFSADELLHTIDHLKKSLYPRYDSNSVMISPPLFRIQYKNLINAGENQTQISANNGVLAAITGFSANFLTDVNKIAFRTDGKKFAYPKVFDIDMTFTILNENLVQSQRTDIYNEKYFYDYEHNTDHTSSREAEQAAVQGTLGEGYGVLLEEDATVDFVLSPN